VLGGQACRHAHYIDIQSIILQAKKSTRGEIFLDFKKLREDQGQQGHKAISIVAPKILV